MMKRIVLKSVETNNGFLEEAQVSFGPRLTCIIGARGTCKSTVVESIRYALNAGTRSQIDQLAGEGGKVYATLGAGSVRCNVEVHDGDRITSYVIEREIDAPPRITSADNGDPIDGLEIFEAVEIYSQGDLQAIASSKDPEQQMQLVDRPNRVEIAELQRRISSAIGSLRVIGSKLRTARLESEKRRNAVRDIELLRTQLAALLGSRPELPPSLSEQHAAYMKRQRVLQYIDEIRNVQQTVITRLDDAIRTTRDIESISLRIAGEELASDVPQRLLQDLSNSLLAISETRHSIIAIPIDATSSKLQAAFGALNRDYFDQRQQEVALSESLKQEDLIKKQLAELERAERELKQFESDMAELSQERRSLRTLLSELRDRIYNMRVAEADTINAQYGDVVLLSVERSGTSASYIRRLSLLLMGSRIRGQEEIAEELATTFSPADLLDIIEHGDAGRVSTALQRDLGQITRAITYLRDHPDLYELEGDSVDDTLQMTMFDNGVSKSIEDLSAGQRATALLPLILRSASYPLIIDQPEDDLDNSFIFRVLVENVRKLKDKRQLIFVTHNANIPVLGEAEQVVVMHMASPTKADAPTSGSLEDRKYDVLDLLEGGEEAFARREERYRSVGANA